MQPWLDNNLGKSHLTPDPPYGIDGQCVNAASSWSMALGGPDLRGATAYSIWQNFRHPFFEVIPIGQKPLLSGDIVFFLPTTETGPGHVDIAVDNITSTGFRGADANISGNPALEYINHKYTGVVGWFRPAGGVNMNKEQATKLALYLRLAAGATVEQANANAAYDVAHILADPGYAAALAFQIYQSNEIFRYKARHYDADVAAAKASTGTVLASGNYTVK